VDIHNRKVSGSKFAYLLISIKMIYIFEFVSSTDGNQYQDTLLRIASYGVQIQTIGLGNIGDQAYMRTFGASSIVIDNYLDPLNGIANNQNNQLTSYLFQLTTSKGIGDIMIANKWLKVFYPYHYIIIL
jgi:hypothetical protein